MTKNVLMVISSPIFSRPGDDCFLGGRMIDFKDKPLALLLGTVRAHEIGRVVVVLIACGRAGYAWRSWLRRI